MRFHPSARSIRPHRSILAVLDRALAGHRQGRRTGFRGIVLGTQSQCDQRKRIDFAGALQLLLALKTLEGIAAILIPHPACLLGFQIALGHQRLLDLLVPLRSWSHLPRPPGRWPALPAASGGGRSGSRELGMAATRRAGFGRDALAGRGSSSRGLMRHAGCNRSLAGSRLRGDRLGRGLYGWFRHDRRVFGHNRRRRFLGLRLRRCRGGTRHYRCDGIRNASHIRCFDSNKEPRFPGLGEGLTGESACPTHRGNLRLLLGRQETGEKIGGPSG